MFTDKEYIAAIDLGTNTVVTAIGARGEGGKLDVVACVSKESQGVSRGEIKNIELVAQSLKEAMAEVEGELGAGIVEAYAGISGQHIHCVRQHYHVFVGKDTEIKKEDVDRLNESMRNVQAAVGEKIIEIIPQNYLVDDEETSQPVGMFGKKLDANFNFVIGNSEAVGRVGKALDRVGVKQMKLHLNALAAASAVTTPDERELGVAVVDIGGGTTDLCIYFEDQVRYMAVIPLGSSAINKDIRSYGILERHIEKLKVNYGSAYSKNVPSDKYVTIKGLSPRDAKEISLQQLSLIVESRMMDIVEFVMEEIEESGYKGRLRAGIVLTGGGAALKDVEMLFREATGFEVRVGTAAHNVTEASVEKVDNPAFSTAIGLLIKSFEDGQGPTKLKKVNTLAKGSINQPVVGGKESVPPTVSADDYDPDEDYETKPRKSGWLGKLVKKAENAFKNTFDDVINDTDI